MPEIESARSEAGSASSGTSLRRLLATNSECRRLRLATAALGKDRSAFRVQVQVLQRVLQTLQGGRVDGVDAVCSQ